MCRVVYSVYYSGGRPVEPLSGTLTEIKGKTDTNTDVQTDILKTAVNPVAKS